jgi:hypothetical protein
VQLHKLVNSYWHSGTALCLHLQGSSSWDPSWSMLNLKMEAGSPSKMLLQFNSWENIISQKTWINNTTANCNNPKTCMCWLHLHDTFKLHCTRMLHWQNHHEPTTTGHTTKGKDTWISTSYL